MVNYNLEAIDKIIDYSFKNKQLLIESLTHASNTANNISHTLLKKNYDRLEILGDAVLQLLITERLLKEYPKKNTGEISKLRSLLVCKENLSNAAVKMTLNNFIILGDSLSAQKNSLSDKILSDLVESLLGAVYIDENDKGAAFHIIGKIIDRFIWHNEASLLKNFSSKALLNEKLQKKQLTPIYQYTKKISTDHNSVIFNVDLIISDKKIASGSNKSKKIAEEMAAAKALDNNNF